MKQLIIIISILFFTRVAAQTGTGVVSGSVRCAGKPVPFVNAGIKSLALGAASDINGNFTINNVPPGEHELIISAVGYQKFIKKIEIEQDKTTSLNIEIKESVTELNQVVITGTMKETFVAASPVKVEVITAQHLLKSPTNNVMEAINTVNGVQEQINCGVCGTSDIHINGMEGPYTLVLIDGMPIMSALSSVYGLNGIATSLIERIEIIKGPSSTLYGSEAVGGVINIIAKKPENAPLWSLNAFATSHKEKNTDISFAPKSGKIKSLFSGNFYHLNNFIDENNDNFNDVPLASRISLFNKTSVKRKNNRLLTLSGKYYYENRFGGVEEWSEEFRGSDSIYGESIYTKRYELMSAYQLPVKENIRWDVSFNNHDQDSYYGNTLYDAKQSIIFSNLSWDKRFGARHDLIAGTTFRYQYYDDNTPATLSADKKFIPGIFAQDEYTLSDKITLLGGMRMDHHQNHGLIFSPRFNVKYKPGIYTTFRLNAGTGFRVVNLFTEEHAALTGARTVVVKDKLRPEESYNTNLNFNHVFSLGESSCTLDADVFYTYFKNKIIPDYNTDPNLIVYDNLDGYSVSRGVSLSFRQSFKFPLKVSTGGTFLDVFSVDYNVEGERTRETQEFAPAFSGVFSVSYTINKIRTSVDYSGRVVGPMHLPVYNAPFSRAEISPWFSVQHLQVTHEVSKRFSFYTGARNILNYTQPSPLIDPANPFGDNFDTAYAYGPLQGRRFFLGIRFSY